MASVPGIRTVPGRVGLSLNGSIASTAFQCHPGGKSEAVVLFSLAALGMMANLLLMLLILTKRHLRSRWSQGLLFHQGLVDCARAAVLVPLGVSVLRCQSLRRCSLLETTFVLLVTVSTINMLTTVLNDAPLIPNEEDNPLPLLMDSPHCVIFGMGMIWFAGLTINLGPTFLTGALAVSQDLLDACPLVYGPMRHHVLNILWILVNLLCVALTFFHLRKLYRDFTRRERLAEVDRAASLVTALVSVQCDSMGGADGGDGLADHHRRVRGYVHRLEREGVERVKMFVTTTVAYVLFWCPLFILTIADPTAKSYSLSYEVTLHIAFVHAIVNPTLLLILHKGLRRAAADLLCCYCCYPSSGEGQYNGGHLGSLRHRHQSRHSSGNMEGFPPFAVVSDDEAGSPPCQHYTCTAAAAVNRNYMETTL